MAVKLLRQDRAIRARVTNQFYKCRLAAKVRAKVIQTLLCSAQQPDKPTGQCILYCGHEGPHQTFVAEWNEGAVNSRRRQPRSARPVSHRAETPGGHSRTGGNR